ncbi:unnamed protein product [Arabidopsis thaliana]|jgi:hypothetical protein|uniref:Transmembrane protein n=4 Tax=Arabidopsis TaxID=3701 RepID=A0A654EPK5_ARATH|nr:uncharacterized protein AT1G76728 [Arabidopsis thaliana]KAG7651938.1 hypothetical protein ISN45_At01g067490 [Arabidopsis thaliana x Arabidopsis arenosa]KAG7659809.1 hypothetical protein ISN44_As01g066370 [Arabidopsis suecica]AEE35882.1 transmembrane protein [Arabidopsis thaliana]CAA0338408.1 unnamed protein product [Arabidopsis thaliana]VYS51243.1 unnamed protein product [Arabidopsis thaliana]|eukprot:NP_001117607.1 transmembrane protein [Arabidopsis thaliana]
MNIAVAFAIGVGAWVIIMLVALGIWFLVKKLTS